MKTNLPIQLSVPATTANLGPGFDCLGLALDKRLKLRAVRASSWAVTTIGEGSEVLPSDESNLIVRANRATCESKGRAPMPFHIEIENMVPLCRGLGSSAAAISAGVALAHLSNSPRIDRQEMVKDAVTIEGHPDNVTPAILGGLHLTAGPMSSWRECSFSPRLRILIVIPRETASTDDMRNILPTKYSQETLRRNQESLTKLLEGLEFGKAELLRYSEVDLLHQPYRFNVLKTSSLIFETLKATAWVNGAFLSGSGTSVGGWLLDSRPDADELNELTERLKEDCPGVRLEILYPDSQGLRVIDSEGVTA